MLSLFPSIFVVIKGNIFIKFDWSRSTTSIKIKGYQEFFFQLHWINWVEGRWLVKIVDQIIFYWLKTYCNYQLKELKQTFMRKSPLKWTKTLSMYHTKVWSDSICNDQLNFLSTTSRYSSFSYELIFHQPEVKTNLLQEISKAAVLSKGKVSLHSYIIMKSFLVFFAWSKWAICMHL